MKSSRAKRNLSCLVIFCVALLALAALSNARPQPTSSISIVNNSSRTIRNVYLSHVDAEDWSGNQLGDTAIAPGQSVAISNFACDQQQIKVIGEDQDGCFLSTVVACGSNATWTITNDTTADCGQ
jgi:hypothetical protein